MSDMDTVMDRLRNLQRDEMETLMFGLARTHATACLVASGKEDGHASEASMRKRVSSMSDDALVAALAPMAALASLGREREADRARG